MGGSEVAVLDESQEIKFTESEREITRIFHKSHQGLRDKVRRKLGDHLRSLKYVFLC